MTNDEYIEAAIQTGGYRSKFYGKLVTVNLFQELLAQFIKAGDKLDKVKKALFYGKTHAFIMFEGEKTLDGGSQDQKLIDIIHGMLGIATESVELLEALGKSEIDEVNVKEELGDVLWYVAIMCKKLNCTFEELQLMNIAKLRARFPDRFKEHDAINRDLANERKVLEGG